MTLNLRKRVLGVAMALALGSGVATAQAEVIFSDTFNSNVNNWTGTGMSWDSNDGNSGGAMKLSGNGASEPQDAYGRTDINISTSGFGGLNFSFDYKDISGDQGDKLHVLYCKSNCGTTSLTNWIEIGLFSLNVNGYQSASIGVSTALDNLASVDFRFFTDTNRDDEGAYIDNVKLIGTKLTAAVPEPATLALLGLGLLGIGISRRKST